MKLTKNELQKLRDVRIHSIINIRDDGRNQMINCVFHNEKEPSLLIDNKNGFHCFGCSRHGSGAIDFIVELTGCTFIEALEELTKYV